MAQVFQTCKEVFGKFNWGKNYTLLVDTLNEMEVEIDLDLSAQANARKVYHAKKFAATKERKTIDSHSVAMKSAEKKTKQGGDSTVFA